MALGGKSGILLGQAVLLFLCKYLGIFPLLWTLVPYESEARTPPLRIVKGARGVTGVNASDQTPRFRSSG